MKRNYQFIADPDGNNPPSAVITLPETFCEYLFAEILMYYFDISYSMKLYIVSFSSRATNSHQLYHLLHRV